MTEFRAPPQSIAAWSSPLRPPMQWMTYDLNGVSGVHGLLSVIYLTGRVDTYALVPQAVAQAFPLAGNQTEYLRVQIQRVYPECLLISQTNKVLQTTPSGVLFL